MFTESTPHRKRDRERDREIERETERERRERQREETERETEREVTNVSKDTSRQWRMPMKTKIQEIQVFFKGPVTRDFP